MEGLSHHPFYRSDRDHFPPLANLFAERPVDLQASPRPFVTPAGSPSNNRAATPAASSSARRAGVLRPRLFSLPAFPHAPMWEAREAVNVTAAVLEADERRADAWWASGQAAAALGTPGRRAAGGGTPPGTSPLLSGRMSDGSYGGEEDDDSFVLQYGLFHPDDDEEEEEAGMGVRVLGSSIWEGEEAGQQASEAGSSGGRALASGPRLRALDVAALEHTRTQLCVSPIRFTDTSPSGMDNGLAVWVSQASGGGSQDGPSPQTQPICARYLPPHEPIVLRSPAAGAPPQPPVPPNVRRSLTFDCHDGAQKAPTGAFLHESLWGAVAQAPVSTPWIFSTAPPPGAALLTGGWAVPAFGSLELTAVIDEEMG